MNTKCTRRIVVNAWLLVGLFLSSSANAQATQDVPAPDNTKVNQRDSETLESTADQQKNNRSDLRTTKRIRQSIMRDKSLSTYGHNVKIISKNGIVILKGPVRSEDEKRVIEAKAAEVVGAGKLRSELEVQPKK